VYQTEVFGIPWTPRQDYTAASTMTKPMLSPRCGTEMKDRSKHQFERWAGSYDRSPLHHVLFRPSYIALMEEISRWYNQHRRPFRLLDIGCGTGELAGMLACSPWPVAVVGLDYAANMCVAASAKARAAGTKGSARFVNGDSEFLPFGDGVFDVVTCSNSFHHYPHQANVVRDMRRVLRADGRLIVIDGFRDCVIGWLVYDVIIDRIEGRVHHVPWTVMDGYFREAGFTNIRRRKFSFLFPAFATMGDR